MTERHGEVDEKHRVSFYETDAARLDFPAFVHGNSFKAGLAISAHWRRPRPDWIRPLFLICAVQYGL